MLLLIEKYLFYFLLFSIPFQTRKILYYSGWKFNEWQSASIYFTDILFLVLILFWIYDVFFSLAPKAIPGFVREPSTRKLKIYEYFLFIFVIFSAVSLKNSSNLVIGFYQLTKLIEFIIFFFYLKNYAIYKFGFTNSLFAIFYGGLLQAIIAVAQFLKQSNLGLGYLGESVFNFNMNGVASFYNFYGEKVIRAYGTTPHSNVLAAYLFMALFAFYFIWFYPHTITNEVKKEPRGSHSFGVGVYKRLSHDRLLFLGYLITLWAFFLTFARVAFFVMGANFIIKGFLLFTKFKRYKSKRVWQLVAYTIIIVVFFTVLYWPELISRIQISGQEEAVQLRNFYNKESLQTISWTGTGIGDFVNELELREPMLSYYLYQPVHNIYLLINSETGVLGISAFALFLVFLIKDFIVRTRLERFHHYYLLLLFSSFLFMGLFDHFLWTIQQGRFIFWLILAFMAVNESDDLLTFHT